MSHPPLAGGQGQTIHLGYLSNVLTISRLVKTPKLHWLDSGVACYLLGIRTREELRLHPLRGAIFESWVVSEIMKAHRNVGHQPKLSFFRDAHGLEIDILIEDGVGLTGVDAAIGRRSDPCVFLVQLVVFDDL